MQINKRNKNSESEHQVKVDVVDITKTANSGVRKTTFDNLHDLKRHISIKWTFKWWSKETSILIKVNIKCGSKIIITYLYNQSNGRFLNVEWRIYVQSMCQFFEFINNLLFLLFRSCNPLRLCRTARLKI